MHQECEKKFRFVKWMQNYQKRNMIYININDDADDNNK